MSRLLTPRVGNPDLTVLSLLRDLLKAHGALGFRDESAFQRVATLSEADKLKIVPLVFWLLPRSAIHKRSQGAPVKPLIRAHLDQMLVNHDEELLDVLKAVADAFVAHRTPGGRRRKFGIADLRQRQPIYRKILARQEDRCAICGIVLGIDGRETLDHIIPYGLIGDSDDGANWQILCEPCNSAKGHNLSALQMREAMNWVYKDCPDAITRDVRYVMLASIRRCQHPECGKDSLRVHLNVAQSTRTGLDVAGHLVVLCDEHAASALA